MKDLFEKKMYIYVYVLYFVGIVIVYSYVLCYNGLVKVRFFVLSF